MQAQPFGIADGKSESVVSALEKGGANLFARALFDHSRLKKMIDDGQIRVILAPVDVAVQSFLRMSSSTIAQLGTTTAGRDIVENHFSSMDGERAPFVMTINNQSVSLNGDVIRQQYGPRGIVDVATSTIVFISVLFSNPDQVKKLQIQRSPGLRSAISADALTNVISQGNIRGRDLINLCNTNFEANEFCNRKDANSGETMFHRLLRQEFNVSLAANQDAREAYILQHNSSLTYVRKGNGNVRIGRHRYIKVSDDRHLQIFPQHIRDSGLNILYCIGTDHKLKAYGEDRRSYYGPVALMPQLTITGLPADFKIRKVTGDINNVLVLGYDGRFFISPGRKNNDTTIVNFITIESDRNPGFSTLDIDFNNRLVVNNGQKQVMEPLKQRTVSNDAIKITGDNAKTVMEIRDGSVVIAHWNSTFSLQSFPGGSYEANFNKVKIIIDSSYNLVLVLNNEGELWSQLIDRVNQVPGEIEKIDPSKWVKLNVPGGGKIIWMQERDLDAFNKDIVIDDRGGIYRLSVRWNKDLQRYGDPTFVLMDTIPDVMAIHPAGETRNLEYYDDLWFILSMRNPVTTMV